MAAGLGARAWLWACWSAGNRTLPLLPAFSSFFLLGSWLHGRRGRQGHVDVVIGRGSGLRALWLRRLGSAPVGRVTAGGWERGAVGERSIDETTT